MHCLCNVVMRFSFDRPLAACGSIGSQSQWLILVVSRCQIKRVYKGETAARTVCSSQHGKNISLEQKNKSIEPELLMPKGKIILVARYSVDMPTVQQCGLSQEHSCSKLG